MGKSKHAVFDCIFFLLLLLLFFSFFFFFHSVSAQLPPNQISTMNKLDELLRNSSSGSLIPWDLSKDSNPCSWGRVFCSTNNSSVIKLSLSGLSLPSSDFLIVVCQIDTLTSLDVSNNRLSSIPSEFISDCGKIGELKLLNFSGNRLVGNLPNFLDGFEMLEALDLSHNYLSGNIDLQLDGLVSLKSLNLSSNHLNGTVPIHLGKSYLLQELQLSANSFLGKIPQEIAEHRNLFMIDLSGNNLSGSIPDGFSELSKLQVLILSDNNLSGGIPSYYSNITTLSRFAANQNRFTGSIPRGITAHLKNLDLSYNRLNGTVPSDLLSPYNLQSVDLSYNLLDDSIPANMSPSLVRLRLGGNHFRGTIPSESLGNLQKLTYLELENNTLTGPIPFELGMCKNLALLNLAYNNLSSTLPRSLGNLNNLQVLSLKSNNFIGEIPVEITQLNALQRLYISRNSLNGSIPSSISKLQNLTNLDLSSNNISGTIPRTIASLNSLIELQLGSNQLGGNIPLMPRSLQIAVNLSHNLFAGPIPRVLDNLVNLEFLDLSNNRFSGEIPQFLVGMSALSELILSNNQLSGVVPTFGPQVNVVTVGNNDLIYRRASPESRKRKKSVVAEIVIPLVSAVLGAGVVGLIALLVTRRFYRVKGDDRAQTELGFSSPQIIEKNLLTTNGIHRSKIDFNKAMKAVIDPENVVLKTRFSSYYKAIMSTGATYFVKKLNWSDKIIQLGSHEKIEQELCVLGKLSNSNVMVPLAYALTAESAYLFYEFAEKGTLSDVLHGNLPDALDWDSRYSIAEGVAQGLAFLHGCTSGPILVLNLSSKTILLKSLKEPQIGDVELYKVIEPSKSTSNLSTVVGSVGYIPPEYAYTMRLTAAGNVYSFGVILLELVTGKQAISNGIELRNWVLRNSDRNKWDQIIDFRVSRTSVSTRSQMLAVLKVALACVNISPEARPKMKSALQMLLNARYG